MTIFGPDSTPDRVYRAFKDVHFTSYRTLGSAQKVLFLCSVCGLIAVTEITADRAYRLELIEFHAKYSDIDLQSALYSPKVDDD